jgi:hypothetical protein
MLLDQEVAVSDRERGPRYKQHFHVVITVSKLTGFSCYR